MFWYVTGTAATERYPRDRAMSIRSSGRSLLATSGTTVTFRSSAVSARTGSSAADTGESVTYPSPTPAQNRGVTAPSSRS